MFGPSYGAGCLVCSSIADNLEANAVHLAARDVTVLLSSRAKREVLQMGYYGLLDSTPLGREESACRSWKGK